MSQALTAAEPCVSVLAAHVVTATLVRLMLTVIAIYAQALHAVTLMWTVGLAGNVNSGSRVAPAALAFQTTQSDLLRCPFLVIPGI